MNSDRLYIAPYNCDGRVGWLVRVSWYPEDRRGKQARKWHSKLFEFKDFPSEDQTLNAAREYRDQWLAANSDKMLKRRTGFLLSDLPKNNKTGILGVTFSNRQVTPGYREIRWQVTYPHPTKYQSPIHRTFSVRRLGEINSLLAAVECRREGMLAAIEARSIERDENAYEMIGFYDDVIENLKRFAGSKRIAVHYRDC